jgi:hypothetical protein
MAVWTHNICWSCWAQRYGTRMPVRTTNAMYEVCCYCGNETRSGIAVRDNEENTPHCKEKINAR